MRKSLAAWPLAMAPLVGSLLIFAAPTSAQNYLGGYLQQKQLNDMRMMQQRGIEKRRQQQQQQQQGGQVQAPSSAQRNLTAHQQACAQRCRTYNPQTNTYTVRPGVQAQCQL